MEYIENSPADVVATRALLGRLFSVLAAQQADPLGFIAKQRETALAEVGTATVRGNGASDELLAAAKKDIEAFFSQFSLNT